jgi:hypothetical protein
MGVFYSKTQRRTTKKETASSLRETEGDEAISVFSMPYLRACCLPSYHNQLYNGVIHGLNAKSDVKGSMKF